MSYRRWKQEEWANGELASQPEKLYIKVEEQRRHGLLASLHPCAQHTEMWARKRAAVPLWNLLRQMFSHRQCQTQLCVPAHMDRRSEENIFYLIAQSMPAQQHLEMLWKYISKNIFCFVCRLCQMYLLPAAIKEACETPYLLLMKTDLIWSYTFLYFAELFECPGERLLSLKRASPSSAFIFCTSNPPLPMI